MKKEVSRMTVEFPQIDQIIHASLEENAYSQKEYVRLMNQCNNFINLTFQEYLDRISREYNQESIIDILSMVNTVLKEEEEACQDNKIIYDDFVKNASLVSQSLKKIINSPSRKLIKVEKSLPANRVTQFDSKTMTWLSRRSGLTIEEKISPRNVIPTKVTHFTADTVENRHTMYLFDILYDYLYEKIYPEGMDMPCENCQNKEKKCHELYDQLKTILFLKQKVRSTDLNEVPKQKQLRQNNKLLSDKEYKQIWDAVRDIDYYEQNCKNVWNHLEERYRFIVYIIVCTKISAIDGVEVYDNYSQLIDHEGIIALLSDEGINVIKFFEKKNDDEIIVSLRDKEISVLINRFCSKNGVSFRKEKKYYDSFEVTGFFDEIEKINEYENLLMDLEKQSSELRENIAKIQDSIEDFEYKKDVIQLLVKTIALRMEAMKSDETKEIGK